MSTKMATQALLSPTRSEANHPGKNTYNHEYNCAFFDWDFSLYLSIILLISSVIHAYNT